MVGRCSAQREVFRLACKVNGILETLACGYAAGMDIQEVWLPCAVPGGGAMGHNTLS